MLLDGGGLERHRRAGEQNLSTFRLRIFIARKWGVVGQIGNAAKLGECVVVFV